MQACTTARRVSAVAVSLTKGTANGENGPVADEGTQEAGRSLAIGRVVDARSTGRTTLPTSGCLADAVTKERTTHRCVEVRSRRVSRGFVRMPVTVPQETTFRRRTLLSAAL